MQLFHKEKILYVLIILAGKGDLKLAVPDKIYY